MSLLDGIAEMFAELTGRDRLWEAIERYAAGHNAREYSYLKEWRARNREKVRAYNRRSTKAWKKRNRDKVKAAHARYRVKHPDVVRAAWRRAAKKKRDKLRAARTGAVRQMRAYRCRGCGMTGHNRATCAAERSAA